MLSEALDLVFCEEDAGDRKVQSRSRVAAPDRALLSGGLLLWGVLANDVP